MTQQKINKVIEWLKSKPENEKAVIMVKHLEKDTLEVKNRGEFKIMKFTLDAKWDFIRKNIQHKILNKILKGE